MKKRINLSNPCIMAVSILLLMTGFILIDGSTSETLALTTEDCRVCHTGAGSPEGTVASQHHVFGRACFFCHGTIIGDPPDYICFSCHSPGNKGLATVPAHVLLHDKTDVIDPVSCDISCHNPNAVDEHLKYPTFESPTSQMACEKCHFNTNTDPAQGPVQSDIEYAITIGSSTAVEPQVVTCDVCHINIGAQGHAAAHDNVLPDPGGGCDTAGCHNSNVMTEHTDRGWECGTCHTPNPMTLDPATVKNVVDTASGPYDPSGVTTKYCTDCHTVFAGHAADHDQVFFLMNPSFQDCTRCHEATDPSVNPNAANVVAEHLTKQGLTCTTCHDGFNYSIPDPTTGDPIYYVINTINKGRSPSNQAVYCIDCHRNDTLGQGTGHNPVIVDPWSECAWCHTIDIFGIPEHNMHLEKAQDIQRDCSVCHVPEGTQPECSLCHSLEQTIWDPLPDHKTLPNTSLNIIGPGTEDHDKHTNPGGPLENNCDYCHVSGVPGADPLPVPYSECANCHNGVIASDISFNSTIHTVDHIQGAEALGQSCSYCHSQTPSCTDCHDDIVGPNMPKHDTHTETLGYDCFECHINDIAGSEPLPEPYNECADCHNPNGNADGIMGSDITYGSTIHTDEHIVGGETRGQSCDLCHGIAPPDCSECHIPGHPSVPPPYSECSTCHNGVPTPQTYNLTLDNIMYGEQGHTTHVNQAKDKGYNCMVCHVPEGYSPTCAQCHVPSHPSIPAPYNSCDQCHQMLQPGQATHIQHKVAATNEVGTIDCAKCHVPVGQVPNCGECHNAQPHGPIPAPYDVCSSCHNATDPRTKDIAYGTPVHNSHITAANNNCATCHTAAPDCSACHTGTVHAPVPAPYNSCDTVGCHSNLQPGETVHNEHKVAATVEGIIDCAKCHVPAGGTPNCGECHTAGDHAASHDNAGVPSFGCTKCHDANVVVEHIDNRGYSCATCHDNPTYTSVIDAGKAGTFVSCYDCHGQNMHHDNSNATSGNCTYCHMDPRPLSDDPQQLACRECHINDSGYVISTTQNHAFNTQGSIKDFGACFDCHAPAPYHAKPTTWPGWYEEIQPAPGRGIFNVFKNELQPRCANDCENELENRSGYGEDSQPERRNDDNWRYPVSFNWYQIDYLGQTMNVPVFDQGGAMPAHTHSLINAVGNCGDCHTVGTVVPVTHNNDCIGCHFSNDPLVQNTISLGISGTPVDCFSCHGDQGHEAAHDQTVLTAPECAECHVPNVFNEHVVNRTLTCTDCHDSTDPNVQGAITSGMNGTPVPCQDCHGASAGDHVTAHDNAGVPSPGCTDCHAGNVVTEHVTNRGFTCATCHSSTDQNVINTINTGKAGTFVDCNDCHTQGGGSAHHDNDNARTGNCTYCHADPRLDLDANAPTGQLACRECHVGSNGYVTTGSGVPSHAFNTQSAIQDFGACFDCHLPTPYHAKPTSWPGWYEENQQASGRGTFNLFKNDLQPSCAGDCEGSLERRSGYGEHSQPEEQNDRNWRYASANFNMITIVDQLGTNQQWSVPTFGSGGGSGGGGSQNDSVNITYASYSSYRDRLTVYAENSLGNNNATLTVTYDGSDYQMSWDSSNNRWEVRISSRRCNDSTIEVTSSAGGNDSSSVSGCSGW